MDLPSRTDIDEDGPAPWDLTEPTAPICVDAPLDRKRDRPTHDRRKPDRTDADEDAIVCTVLKDPRGWEALRHLRAADFRRPGIAEIWRAMETAASQGSEITPWSLSGIRPGLSDAEIERLASIDPPGIAAARAAANRLSTVRRASRAAAILRSAARDIEEAAGGIQTNPAIRWTTILSEALSAATAVSGLKETVDGQSLEAIVKRRVSAQSKPLKTGVERLDEFLDGGLRAGTLLGIGGQAKVGKTILATTIGGNLDAAGIPHLMISLERTAEEVAELKLARRLGISASRLHALDDTQKATLDRLPPTGNGAPILHTNDTTIEDIAAEASYQRHARGIELVIVDSLQLIAGKQKWDTDEAHMTRVCQRIRQMASTLKLPVIATVHITEMGTIWRGAGAIRQNANAYLLLNRDNGSRDAFLETIASNLGNEADIGTIGAPALTLSDAGPHFFRANPDTGFRIRK